METRTFLIDTYAQTNIKKEFVDSSNLNDEMHEDFNLQKYHYKEELDLKWDEKHSNNYDENYEISVDNSAKKNEAEESMNQDCNFKSQLENLPPRELINIKKEKPNIGKDENYESYIDNFAEKNEGEESMREDSNLILQDQNLSPMNDSINIKTEKPDIRIDQENNNLGHQRYHYKEELDINWDEKDNNYDKNIKTLSKKSTIKIRDTNVVENPDTEKDCPRCNKRLKNLNTMKKHLFYCGKEPHLQCDSCFYKAKYKNALIVHIIKNHPGQIQKSRKIKATQKTGSSKNKKNKVLKERNDDCIRFCENCKFRTDKCQSKNCSKCKSRLLYQCKKCNATFPSREKWTRHVLDRCDPKGYYHCPACDFKDVIRQSVKSHLKVHMVPGSQVDTEEIKWKKAEGKNDPHLFACRSCGKEFQRKASLASHMRFCIKSDVSKPLTRYIKKRDLGMEYKRSKICSKCKQKSLSKLGQASECCGSLVLFICTKCGQCYERQASINYHVQNICFLEIKHKCDMCDYEGSAPSVASHRQIKHDLNSVECPKCKTKLKNKSTLRFHSYYCGMESLKCNFCSFRYKRNHDFNTHMKKKHPELCQK